MSKGHRKSKIGARLVAGLARRNGLDVIWRLSRCKDSIMAICAGSAGLGVINNPDIAPIRRLMATLAFFRHARVGCRHAGRYTAVVAGGTLSRRILKSSGDVTRLARGFAMASR